MTAKTKPDRHPKVESIVILGQAPSTPGTRKAAAGSVLRVQGANFGSKPGSARVFFDEIGTRPFTTPFSRDELVVTAPLPSVSSSSVRVSVRGLGTSAPFKFAVHRRQKSNNPPGTSMLQLLHAVDEQGALSAQFVRVVSKLPIVDRTKAQSLSIAADGMDGSRLAAQRVYEVWMQWAPLQAAETLEQLKSIDLIDEIIDTSGLTELVRRGTDGLFGAGGLVDTFLPGGVGSLVSELDIGQLAEEIIESPNIKVGRSQRTGSTCAVSPAHLSSSNNHRLNTLRRLLAAAEQAPQPERGLRRRPSTEARKYCSGRSQKNP